jgi:AsmA protein
MHPTETIHASGPTEPAVRPDIRSTPLYRRFVLVYLVLLALLLLALLPSLINVNRYKRRIVTSISTALGRPVHLDSVSLNLLPLPGFTLQNFVVEEDPRFGSEPVIRANTVQATLRVSSLWRGKVEFSTISLTDPSLNLVHTPDGHWNVENLLLQAAHISAAPTAQARPGPTPRFPYIEASNARLNLKDGLEKLPVALTDADLALWLPSPDQWRLRLSGHPARTDASAPDTNSTDSGTLQLEGTFGRAPVFSQIPLDLDAAWKSAPLGATSLILLGRDAGLRGTLDLSASIHGTLALNTLKVHALLSGLRRTDFVPQRPIELDADCQATARSSFHELRAIRCSWPPSTDSGNKLLALTGDLPNIRHPEQFAFEIGTPGLPANTLLNWLRVASNRLPADESVTGALTAKLSHTPSPPLDAARHTPLPADLQTPGWTGDLLLHGATLTALGLGTQPITLGDLAFSSSPTAPPRRTSRGSQRQALRAAQSAATKAGINPINPPASTTFLLAPTTLPLGGREPALLDGRLDATGYTLHLTGTVLPTRLLALAAALPQFGDGLSSLFPNPTSTLIHIDLTTTRPWVRTTANHASGLWTRSNAAGSPASRPGRRHR